MTWEKPGNNREFCFPELQDTLKIILKCFSTEISSLFFRKCEFMNRFISQRNFKQEKFIVIILNISVPDIVSAY